MDDAALRRLVDDQLDLRYKGYAPTVPDATAGDLARRRPRLLDAGFSFPLMTLQRSAVEHNVAALAEYCAEHGERLAPHGKSTMSPELHAMQLAAGAWGLTAATVHEVAVYRSFGVERVLLANVLVDDGAVRWLAAELDRDPDFDFYCYADSVEGVAILHEALGADPAPGRFGVLIEVGYAGGRTGCRSLESVLEVARRVDESAGMRLAGVSGYEGLLGRDATPETIEAVTEFVGSLRAAATAVLDAGLYRGAPGSFVVSCGGSAFFDVVTAELADRWPRRDEATIVLRSGSYVTHDDGLYELASPLTRNPGRSGPLQAGLTIWAHVLSRPDPDRAIVGAGRRDVPFDAGLPRPKVVWRRGKPDPEQLDGATAVKLNDHHLYVEASAESRLSVGDLVGFGISHPCTAFDKWRLIPLLDDDWHVVGSVHTFF
jgi:D-serine deaminase-like pyridoxal phosphate-dependent protein